MEKGKTTRCFGGVEDVRAQRFLWGRGAGSRGMWLRVPAGLHARPWPLWLQNFCMCGWAFERALVPSRKERSCGEFSMW